MSNHIFSAPADRYRDLKNHQDFNSRCHCEAKAKVKRKVSKCQAPTAANLLDTMRKKGCIQGEGRKVNLLGFLPKS